MRSHSALAPLLLAAFALAPRAWAQAPELPALQNEQFLQAPALDIAAYTRALDALKARTQNGAKPADAANEALLRFKIEQAEMCLDVLTDRYKGRTLYNKGVLESIATFVLQRAQQVARAKGDATEALPALLQERAYIAENDGSAQPFWIYVPRDYSPQKKYGLAVFLHGYGPDVSKINPWLPGDEAAEAAHKAGLLLVLPHGRRNTDFVDVGEDDALRVAQEVQKHYPIDPQRVFLTGPSMGGFGVWAAGLHHPSTWAGLAPMSARTDFYLWFKLSRDKVPAWKRIAYDADEPLALAANAAGLPLFFQHGAQDSIVNVEQSRRMDKALGKLKIPHLYREIPGGDHYIYFYDGAYEAAFDWMADQKKPALPTEPARVEYISGNARNEGAHWVRITDRLDYSVPASISVQAVPPAAADLVAGADAAKYLLRVTAKNVAAFTLSPPIAKDAKWKLEMNGQPAEATRAEDGTISWRDAAAPLKAEWPQTKTPRRSGPIKNAWRDPFLIVYGTQVLEGRANLDEARARAWATQWRDYADGAPRIKSDKEVTAEDRQSFNLVLFGDAESNALIKEADARLPLHWTREGVRIGSGDGSKLLSHLKPDAPLDAPPPVREGEVKVPPSQVGGALSAQSEGGRDVAQDAALVDVGANAVWWNYPPATEPRPRELGLTFCYASPWSEQRLIVVQSGPLWGAFLPFNHKWDLLPDWAVYTQNRDASDNTNQTLAAGFFGRNWEMAQ